jgi:hypothetical protein
MLSAERTGVGRGYPPALREAAVEHMVARRAEGASLFEIATKLGVQPITLSRWARKGNGLIGVTLVTPGARGMMDEFPPRNDLSPSPDDRPHQPHQPDLTFFKSNRRFRSNSHRPKWSNRLFDQSSDHS